MPPSPPPRNINPFKALVVLFGDVFFFFGMTFFIIGTVIVLFFTINYMSVARFTIESISSPTIDANAVVYSVERTNTTINDQRVMKYDFEYTVDGKRYLGTIKDHRINLVKGNELSIVVIEDNPEIYAKSSSFFQNFEFSIFLALFFPVVGLVIVYIGIKRRSVKIKMFKYGEYGRGKLSNIERTGVRMNNRYIYKMIFDVKTRFGKTESIIVKDFLPFKLSNVNFNFTNGKTIENELSNNMNDSLHVENNSEYEILFTGNHGTFLNISSPMIINGSDIDINMEGFNLLSIMFLILLLFTVLCAVIVGLVIYFL